MRFFFFSAARCSVSRFLSRFCIFCELSCSFLFLCSNFPHQTFLQIRSSPPTHSSSLRSSFSSPNDVVQPPISIESRNNTALNSLPGRGDYTNDEEYRWSNSFGRNALGEASFDGNEGDEGGDSFDKNEPLLSKAYGGGDRGDVEGGEEEVIVFNNNNNNNNNGTDRTGKLRTDKENRSHSITF